MLQSLASMTAQVPGAAQLVQLASNVADDMMEGRLSPQEDSLSQEEGKEVLGQTRSTSSDSGVTSELQASQEATPTGPQLRPAKSGSRAPAGVASQAPSKAAQSSGPEESEKDNHKTALPNLREDSHAAPAEYGSGTVTPESPATSTGSDLTPKDSPHDKVDMRGRPCHDICHQGKKQSLLSHSNKSMNLRGFFNLIVLVLIAQNARLVLENFMKYGFRIKPIPPTSFQDLIENWPILLSVLLVHLFLAIAYFIEKFFIPAVIPKHNKTGMTIPVAFVIALNAFMVLYAPYLSVKWNKPEPISGTCLLGFSIVWFLKLVSFHHVLYDVRYAQARNEDFLTVCGTKEESFAASKYPQSLKRSEFYTFIWMPTICFQFVYPRTPRIVWLNVLRHAFEMAVCIALMKILIEQFMVIIVQNTFIPNERLLKMHIATIFGHLSERILKLSIPSLYVWLLGFLGLFHHWLNILAELTCFADRQFYLDWWNAASFGEYWRKWNLPIHNFFNRHINKPLLRQGLPRFFVAQLIFIISALVHEYMVAVPLHVGWTGLVFTAFLGQIPLMYLTSLKLFTMIPTAGNVIFWFTFCFTGQPLAIVVYYYLWGVQHGAVSGVDRETLQKLIK